MVVTLQTLLLEGKERGIVQESLIYLLYTCSIGTCHRYLRKSNLCNRFYESTDYIFTNMNQSLISTELDERIFHVLRDDGECGDLISRVLCHYFFAPCGANDQLHLPLAVCPDECHYVQSTCPIQWRRVNSLLNVTFLNTINCTNGSLLQGLAPCCIDAEIKIQCMQSKI